MWGLPAEFRPALRVDIGQPRAAALAVGVGRLLTGTAVRTKDGVGLILHSFTSRRAEALRITHRC